MSGLPPLGCAVLEAGFCRHLERLVRRDGRLRLVRLPVLVGVLRHPGEGVVLFDTGYTPRVRQAAAPWPLRLYPWLVPFFTTEATSVRAGLAASGVAADDVRTIVVSHFHPDHIGGLRDFPRARFVASAEAWGKVKGKGGWSALRLGYLGDLLPPDFEERLDLVEDFSGDAFGPWSGTHDLFGDGRLRLLPLPGHASGQLGLIAMVRDERRVLFVADACWVSAGFRDLVPPSTLTRLLTHDHRAQEETLVRIQAAWRSDPGLVVVPSHCPSIVRGALTCA